MAKGLKPLKARKASGVVGKANIVLIQKRCLLLTLSDRCLL